MCSYVGYNQRWCEDKVSLDSTSDQGFETLKKKIEELPTLVLPSFEKNFQVDCDANNVAVGAFLS